MNYATDGFNLYQYFQEKKPVERHSSHVTHANYTKKSQKKKKIKHKLNWK